jgi:hypothetical protein
VRHGQIDEMNLDQLYDRMRTIREKNERMSKAKAFLDKSSGELMSQSRDKTVKQLPPSRKTNGQDSTS